MISPLFHKLPDGRSTAAAVEKIFLLQVKHSMTRGAFNEQIIFVLYFLIIFYARAGRNHELRAVFSRRIAYGARRT